MYSPFIKYFHTGLASQGYLSVKFNFPYMESKRKIPDRTTVLENTYKTVLENTQSRFQPGKMFIGGKSMGGRIASHIVANGTNSNVNGLFFLGYPLHPPGRTEKLRDQHLYKITQPMLFVSGTNDSFANHDLLSKVVHNIGSNADLYWVESGDHSFKVPDKTGPLNWEEPFQVLLRWLKQHS